MCHTIPPAKTRRRRFQSQNARPICRHWRLRSSSAALSSVPFGLYMGKIDATLPSEDGNPHVRTTRTRSRSPIRLVLDRYPCTLGLLALTPVDFLPSKSESGAARSKTRALCPRLTGGYITLTGVLA